MNARTAASPLEGPTTQQKTLIDYERVQDSNERLRIENARLNYIRATRQQTKCAECEQKDQYLKELKNECEILKQYCEELKKKQDILETKKDESFENGPDRVSPRNLARDGSRVNAARPGSTAKPGARTRGRNLRGGFD